MKSNKLSQSQQNFTMEKSISDSLLDSTVHHIPFIAPLNNGKMKKILGRNANNMLGSPSGGETSQNQIFQTLSSTVEDPNISKTMKTSKHFETKNKVLKPTLFKPHN